ncbi:hypothetical protein EYF80_001896 [Liparis tanakae]|uniref:Uncharacterized protein n=1 Tax=Liparis tanakae TaxID=230148 RepID=A0A4Z2JF92_9TELE|nr:hypothetical protein EYF80_001896 [Liparis tanakae]
MRKVPKGNEEGSKGKRGRKERKRGGEQKQKLKREDQKKNTWLTAHISRVVNRERSVAVWQNKTDVNKPDDTCLREKMSLQPEAPRAEAVLTGLWGSSSDYFTVTHQAVVTAPSRRCQPITSQLCVNDVGIKGLVTTTCSASAFPRKCQMFPKTDRRVAQRGPRRGVRCPSVKHDVSLKTGLSVSQWQNE